jgi:hypothetical protein
MSRRCRVPLDLQHPQLVLPKHGCARCQLLLLLLLLVPREAHLPAIHPGRHRGVLRDLAGSGEAGARPGAVHLPVPGVRLRGRRRLQLLLRRPRREVHGSACGCGRRSRVELLRGGDVRAERSDTVGDGGICGDRRRLGLGFCGVEAEPASCSGCEEAYTAAGAGSAMAAGRGGAV